MNKKTRTQIVTTKSVVGPRTVTFVGIVQEVYRRSRQKDVGEEAARFDWLVAMDGGTVLASGTPAQLLAQSGSETLEQAFIALLPELRRREHRPVVIPPRQPDGDVRIA